MFDGRIETFPMRPKYERWGLAVLVLAGACGEERTGREEDTEGLVTLGAETTSATASASGTGMGTTGGELPSLDGSETGRPSLCPPRTCAEFDWACGYFVDICGNVVDCAAEGRACAEGEVCVGGVDAPTQCVAGDTSCELCGAVPECEEASPTRLTGRVITPGREDDDVGNQVGVPNALVYILRTSKLDELPAIEVGIPRDGTSCDRCEDQDFGPVLTGTITDAQGRFVLEGPVPVGVDFVLVVKAGKFRRATMTRVEADAACQTTELPTALPENPTRLPRDMSDGLAVNIPRIAVSTGEIDAMECVFEKLGIEHAEFGNPGADATAAPRIHLYRGGPDEGTPPGAGARIDDDTPHSDDLFGEHLHAYDLVVANCEGLSWDGEDDFAERDAHGANLIDYVNRGGRVFASHLSFSWLYENGETPYAPETALETGLAPAARWTTDLSTLSTGTGRISDADREHPAPRIEQFAAWMEEEGIASPPELAFSIAEPRSQSLELGSSSEEFVYLEENERPQQFSFNTPYGAPSEAICGRVAYSGFHVSVGGGLSPFADSVFPEHCTGDLTDQEKVLLYMLFDLGACVGDDPPPPPPCMPATCEELGAKCGFAPDGCGGVLDCGPCAPIG